MLLLFFVTKQYFYTNYRNNFKITAALGDYFFFISAPRELQNAADLNDNINNVLSIHQVDSRPPAQFNVERNGLP